MNDSPIHEPRQLVSRLAFLVAVTAFVLSGCNAGTSEREELQLAGPASPPLTAEQWQP